MNKVLLVCCLLLVGGCAATNSPSRIAVLQNPETKQTVECRVDPWGDMNRARQVENCIAVYQKSGYRLIADSSEL